jgi:3-oxoadipate enol-lactonase
VEIRAHADDGCELFATVIGDGPLTVLFSAGIADRVAAYPLGERLAKRCRVVLPDIRGVGRSVWADTDRHGWARYVDDLAVLFDEIHIDRAVVAGAGIGSTIALLAGLRRPDRLHAIVAAGVEAIEVDEQSPARKAVAEIFPRIAAQIENEGLLAAWAPLLPTYPPFIQAMVGDSLPRADKASAAAIFRMLARDRAFDSIEDLHAITVPTLVIPAGDERHPADLAIRCAQIIPHASVADTTIPNTLETADDYARAVAPAILKFVDDVVSGLSR